MLLFSRLICVFIFSVSLAWAEGEQGFEGTHTYVESGVLYSNVQTFEQDSYILKVIGSGSPMTVFWQFEVFQERDYWLNKQVVSVRLGRQVIPDLVTKRWLMRDLSSGVVTHTNDAQEAMRFLTGIAKVAVLDVSILNENAAYILQTKLFLYEAEEAQESWLPLFGNSGIEISETPLVLETFVDDE